MQDLQAEADRRGLDINDYISQMKSVGMTEVNDMSLDVKQEQVYFTEAIDREIVNMGTRGVNTFLKAAKGIGEYGAALEITASDWYSNYIGENEEQKKIRQDQPLRRRKATPSPWAAAIRWPSIQPRLNQPLRVVPFASPA